jgi:hypothetical protein
MRGRIDDWVDWRRDNIWCHFDGSRRSNLLGWLNKGLPAMLQTSEMHRASMQTLRQHTRLDGARPSGGGSENGSKVDIALLPKRLA